MKHQEYLLTLNVPAELEESIVDCLLSLESEDGFSSYEVNSHEHKNIGLSLAEQVAGRQKKLRFQMYVSESGLQALLDKLRDNFAESGIHYWILPVIDSGYV